MYDRILVPLDGSRFSEEMIPHAAGLAARGTPAASSSTVAATSPRATTQMPCAPCRAASCST